MKVLGLDISTSNVGLCLIDSDRSQSNRVVFAAGYPISKVKGLYAKSGAVQTAFLQVSRAHDVDVVVVEEPLEAFRKGMSSAHTIAQLNRFNGIVSFLARTVFDKPVVLCNAVEARRNVGIRLDKKSEIGTKDQVFSWVRSRPEMHNFEWPTKILKSGPRSGELKEEAHCYDIADAFVVSLWGSMFVKIDQVDADVV